VKIKQLMPVWVPVTPNRPKDAEDLIRLRAAMNRTASEES
jgi:hypothetical protein